MTIERKEQSRSLVLRGGLGWLSALMLMAIFYLALSGAAFASGEGHSHDTDQEQVVEGQATPDELSAKAKPEDSASAESGHDNSDGHHGAVDEAVTSDHHSEGSPADDHHDGATTEGEHDHSAHEDGTWATNGLERTYAWLGKFHPAATNFPIALLMAAAFAEFLFLMTGNPALRNATRFCLWTGALSTVGTVILGWGFVGFDFSGDDNLLSAHRWNGTALAVTSLIALWLGERTFADKGSVAIFRVMLFVSAAMAAVNGYLGGKMVYGADHYAWPIS